MKINNGMMQAARALQYWERRQEIVSNNLANADTNGFKAERVFARLMGEAGPVADTATDRSAGSLRPTGSPLDIALGGEGFLVVETPQGERLTRGGAFRLDDQNRIVDANGNALLGESGPITAQGGAITIDNGGRVAVDGKEVGRLRVETVAPDAPLEHAGANLFVTDAPREPVDDGTRLVRQGHLEDSNVNTVGSMVDMISIQRAYSAVQRAMTTLDDVRGTVTNELGKPV